MRGLFIKKVEEEASEDKSKVIEPAIQNIVACNVAYLAILIIDMTCRTATLL